MFGKKKEDFSSVELFVGKGTTITGEVSVSGSAIVEGEIRGNVEVKGELIVEKDGKITSETITAGSFVCSGEVRTERLAAGRVEFRKESRFSGELRYKVLIVEEGAEIEGKVSLEGSDVQAPGEG